MEIKNYMEQYETLKKKHPDAIFLFRTGGFYLCYKQDAIDVSHVLQIGLSRDSNGNEITGFHYHGLDTYLPKIVRANRRVAICDALNGDVAKRCKRANVVEHVQPQTV